jgi:MoaA/NifB/PqqE/SkfB family radical SAM enzyme
LSSERVATIDFHVTSECNQECPYCWGPQDFENPVDGDTALRIVSQVKEVGASRIVFTGGDPLKRSDISDLIRHARAIGLEVALSTTGDELTPEFLDSAGQHLDLVSLPLDGSTEKVNARTKKEGHFAAVMSALDLLRGSPDIDVKVCTPVTRFNFEDVCNIIGLVEEYAATTEARVFYNVFQTFPRAMSEVDWDDLLVSDEEFAGLERNLKGARSIRVNFLGHSTLDKLYAMIFPDGRLVIPRGREFFSYGAFLDIADFDAVLVRSRFDSTKHIRHSRAWIKTRRT